MLFVFQQLGGPVGSAISRMQGGDPYDRLPEVYGSHGGLPGEAQVGCTLAAVSINHHQMN